MKFKAKSMLAMAVLASVMSMGSLVEAAFNYTITFEDGTTTSGTWYGTSSLAGTGTKLEVWGEGQSSGYPIFGGSVNSTYNISGKTAILYSGTVNSVYGGAAYDGDATGNTVIIHDGAAAVNDSDSVAPLGLDTSAVNSSVYGGYAHKGATTKNTVIFMGGTAKYISGGESEAPGAGASTENTVIINGGTIYFGNVYGGFSNGGAVNGNKVIINGGTIDLSSGNGVICGGRSAGGEVSGNQVIINGGNFTDETIYGYGGTPSSHSNNTLQINSPGITLKKVANFEVIDIFEAGSVTINELTVESGCILKVDGAKITGTAAIKGLTSATVEAGSKLYVGSAVPDKSYKILDGSGISVASWLTDEDMADGFRAVYGLLVDTIINNDNEFTIRFKEDPMALKKLDIPNIYSNMPMGSAVQKFVEDVSFGSTDLSVQAAAINTMANMNSLANVQQGLQAVMAMATDALQTNIGTGSRPMLGHREEGIGHKSGDRSQGSGFRKVSAKAKDRAAVKVVEQGKSDEIMPVTIGNETLKYDKTVWANYIHSKKTIDGLKSGHLTQNSTIQYNGITVGADLWSNAKGFGGLALTTATGKTNSNQKGASVKNDTDYHGVSLYQRYDYKDVAILFDLSYTHAKNDVTMSTAGTADVTAKPKSDAYSAGVKVEYPVKVGGSQLTPYAGLRYTHIHTNKYDNSLGISNDIKDQNIVSMPLGVQLKTEFETQREWKFGNILEGGYVLNIGNRRSEQRLGYQGVYDSIDFDVTDRGEYFLKTGFTAKHKDTDFELGYRYTRGNNTKDNKWNFNVTHNFGNSKGLPYKSVLLGKIDLLESANKALRAENVELKAENERKDLELAEVKAENERLKALLENK